MRPICVDTPDKILPNDYNCAQFFDCHNENTMLGNHLMECPYPQLFDTALRKCLDYKDVICGSRFEPTSPCKHCILLLLYQLSVQTVFLFYLE